MNFLVGQYKADAADRDQIPIGPPTKQRNIGVLWKVKEDGQPRIGEFDENSPVKV